MVQEWAMDQMAEDLSMAGIKDFSLPHSTPRPDLRPIQPHIQWVLGSLSPGVKQARHKVDHSPPSSAKVRNGELIPPFPNTPSWCGATHYTDYHGNDLK
jgi:hypothetical protein